MSPNEQEIPHVDPSSQPSESTSNFNLGNREKILPYDQRIIGANRNIEPDRLIIRFEDQLDDVELQQPVPYVSQDGRVQLHLSQNVLQQIYQKSVEQFVDYEYVFKVIDQITQSSIKEFYNILTCRLCHVESTTPARVEALKELGTALVKDTAKLGKLLDEAKDSETSSERREVVFLEASGVACKTLTRILKDNDFRSANRHFADICEQNGVEFFELTQNFHDLFEFFQKEKKVLNEYGVPNAEEYINKGIKVLNDVKEGRISYGGDVLAAVGTLKEATCELERKMLERAGEKERKRKLKEVLVKSIVGVGGAIMIIANFEAEQQGALEPVQASMSGHIGAGIIGAVAAEAIGLIRFGS